MKRHIYSVYHFLQWVQSHLLSIGIVLFLWFLLWHGDGRQESVDLIVSMVLINIALLMWIWVKPQRVIPRIQMVFASLVCVFILISILYSDDAGSTWFSLIRYLDAFLVYGLFYSYSTKRTPMQVVYGLVTFGILAMIAAVYVSLHFEEYRSLSPVSLLKYFQGHHPLISVFLFIYPILLFWWMKTRNTGIFLLLAIYFIGSVVTLSRAGVIIEVICTLMYVVVTVLQKKTVQRIHLAVVGIIGAFCVLLILFPYAKTNTLLTAISHGQKVQSMTIARIPYMQQAIVSIAERPVFGSGLGTFYLQSMRLEQHMFEYSWMPHSLPLEHLADMGLMGSCLLWMFIVFVLWHIIRHIPSDTSSRITVFGLLGGVGSLVAFGMVDIPFGYLLITLVWWMILGVLGGSFVPPTSVRRNYSLVGVLSVLFVLSFLGFLRTVPVSVFDMTAACNPIRMTPVFTCLKDANAKGVVFPKGYRQFVEFFHKKQQYVLMQLGEMEYHAGDVGKATELYRTAAEYDPFSGYSYYPYFRFLAETKQYEMLGAELTRFSLRTLPSSLHEDFIKLGVGEERRYPLYESLFSQEKPMGYYTLYYLIGLSLLQNDPAETEQFWRFSRDAYPDYGHFYVEYASLLHYVFQSPDRARQVLVDCQQRAYPAEECRGNIRDGLREPGALESFIRDGN